jgi:hypothetical protein
MSNHVSTVAMTSVLDEKWWVQGTGSSVTGLDPENRVGDEENGSPGRPVSSGLQVPNEPGRCSARTRSSWWPSRGSAVFLQNVLQLYQQRWVILCADSLTLWKIINRKDAIFITKYIGKNFPGEFFKSEFLGGGVSCYAATPLIGAVSPCRSGITRFRPWSSLKTGNHWDRTKQKNSKCCSDDWHRWRFWSAFRHFEIHFSGSFHMSKFSWMIDPTYSREMPNYSAIDPDGSIPILVNEFDQ